MRRIVGNKTPKEQGKKQEFSQSLMANDHLELHATSPAPQNGNRSNPPSEHGSARGGSGRVDFETNPMRSPPVSQHAANYSSLQPAPVQHETDPRNYFRAEEGYTWDFCMVVPNPAHYERQRREKDDKLRSEGKPIPSITHLNPNKVTFEDIIERLFIAGLQTYSFSSGDGDEIYIKVRAPLEILKRHANETKFIMQYDPTYLRNYIDRKHQPIADDPEITTLTPYQFIYGPYDDGKRVFPSVVLFVFVCFL
jgi:hypothetical protein